MPQVVVILGSESDQQIVDESQMLDILNEIGVSWELSIISSHRNPQELQDYCARMVEEGAEVFIGIAGMSAALPGMIAADTGMRLPVIGVPLASDILDGLDALCSIARMPPGVPVAACGIGKSGLVNAALFACQIVALRQSGISDALQQYLKRKAKPAQIALQKGEELYEPGRATVFHAP